MAFPMRRSGSRAVDRYPALLAELMRRGWSDADIAKLAGANVFRVMAGCEHVTARLRSQQASETVFEASEKRWSAARREGFKSVGSCNTSAASKTRKRAEGKVNGGRPTPIAGRRAAGMPGSPSVREEHTAVRFR